MLFLPRLVPEPSTLGPGALHCGVCPKKDCAVTITASFDMIAATTGFVPGRYHAAATPLGV